jgi:hypothetical protein
MKFITTTPFFTYFNIPVNTCKISNKSTFSMLDATGLNGGGCAALARQGVSALLSAAAFPTKFPWPAGITNFTQLYNAIRNAFLNCSCDQLANTLAAINANNEGTWCSNLANLTGAVNSGAASFTPGGMDNNGPLLVYPNPHQGVVNFRFTPAESGRARLEVFTLLGQRLAVVYEGNVTAGIPMTVTYRTTSYHTGTLIYKLVINGDLYTGKLLYLPR